MHGGFRQAVKTSDCGSDMHGFESHNPPFFQKQQILLEPRRAISLLYLAFRRRRKSSDRANPAKRVFLHRYGVNKSLQGFRRVRARFLSMYMPRIFPLLNNIFFHGTTVVYGSDIVFANEAVHLCENQKSLQVPGFPSRHFLKLGVFSTILPLSLTGLPSKPRRFYKNVKNL